MKDAAKGAVEDAVVNAAKSTSESIKTSTTSKDAAKVLLKMPKPLIIKELKPKTKLLFPLPTDLPTPGEKLDLDTQDPNVIIRDNRDNKL